MSQSTVECIVPCPIRCIEPIAEPAAWLGCLPTKGQRPMTTGNTAFRATKLTSSTGKSSRQQPFPQSPSCRMLWNVRCAKCWTLDNVAQAVVVCWLEAAAKVKGRGVFESLVYDYLNETGADVSVRPGCMCCAAVRIASYSWFSPITMSRSLAFNSVICSVMPLMRS